MKVAIFTNFSEMNPGYSLTGIATDQIRMLVRYGCDVHLYLREEYNDEFDHLIPEKEHVTIHADVPHATLIDYESHEDLNDDSLKLVDRLVPYLRKELEDVDIAFTHDWIFTGWNLPFAVALHKIRKETRHVGFLHWIHSIPTGERDWWYLENYGDPDAPMPDNLPKNHKVVSFSQSNLQQLIEQFHCTTKEACVIPHIKDLRTWFEFGDDTEEFLDEHPGVMQADIVIVYPTSCDRLNTKRVHHVINLTAALKRRSLCVAMICANQWASHYAQKERIESYYDLAEGLGLVTARNKPAADYAEEFIFTSEFLYPKYELGIPRRMLRELMLVSNLFVFPTREESFGLVAPEAALCGNFMVLNKDLDILAENFLHQGSYFSFGSLYHDFKPDSWERYLNNVAGAILTRMRQNEIVMTRTYARQRFNFDYLWHRAYEPAMQELMLTCRG